MQLESFGPWPKLKLGVVLTNVLAAPLWLRGVCATCSFTWAEKVITWGGWGVRACVWLTREITPLWIDKVNLKSLISIFLFWRLGICFCLGAPSIKWQFLLSLLTSCDIKYQCFHHFCWQMTLLCYWIWFLPKSLLPCLWQHE